MSGKKNVINGEEVNVNNLFFGGTNLFNVVRNIREFEWDEKPTMWLFEQINDSTPEEPAVLDFIVATPTKDSNIPADSMELNRQMYDVHDGGQRFTTFTILLAVIRHIIDKAIENKSRRVVMPPHIRKKFITNLETITDVLFPTNLQENDFKFPLIEVRHARREFFMSLLYDGPAGTVTKKRKSSSLKATSPPTKAMEKVYNCLHSALKDMSPDHLLSFIQKGKLTTFLFVEFIDERMAIKWVMDRKHETKILPEHFFRYALVNIEGDTDESKQAAMDRWDRVTKDVTGSRTVEHACVMRAELATNTKLKSSANTDDEVDLFNQFVQNSTNSNSTNNGLIIFEHEVETFITSLHNFRAFQGNPKSSLMQLFPDTQRQELWKSLYFLSDACKTSQGKDIEIAILALLAHQPEDLKTCLWKWSALLFG